MEDEQAAHTQPAGTQPAGTQPAIARPAIAAGWLAASSGLPLLLLGAVPSLQLSHGALAAAAALIPYGTLAWLAATAAWLASRSRPHRLAALATAAALAVHVAWTAPYWPADAASPSDGATPADGVTPTVTVLTANLYFGRADVPALAGLVAREQPDVVVLQEVPEPTWDRLRASEAAQGLPYALAEGQAPWGSEGAAILSRHPMEPLETGDSTRGVRFVARVAYPDRPFTLVAVHVTNPLVDVTAWAADLEAIAVAVADLPGPVVVAGDFNATRENAPLRRLLATTGLRDAAELAGAGWSPTFPATLPLVGLDHVLVDDNAAAHHARTVTLAGSDHRGLVVELSMEDPSRRDP